MVIWLIGLSGAGKTMIGKVLYQQLKNKKQATVFVDGDDIRAIFAQSSLHDYSIEGRRISAERIQEICLWLDKQGIDVVCCNLGLFTDINNNNRNIFSTYKEIFIDVPIKNLINRDNKGLYSAALNGERSDVVGINIKYTTPLFADLIIKNSQKTKDINRYVEKIILMINKDVM
ncbi:MAG: adenylyl-sulfate kinase [Psychromonas sp.]|nr:adenylyl-sulfate kinase [Psychromonas sp.]